MVLMESAVKRERKVWTDPLDLPAHNEEKRETKERTDNLVKMDPQEAPRQKVTVEPMGWMALPEKKEKKE